MTPIEAADFQGANYKDRRTKPCREWLRFNRKNPHVYDILVGILRQAKQRGFKQWSIQGALEIARWERKFTVDAKRDVKLPNEYAAYYSRLIMMQEDDLYNFMRVTKSPADYELGWDAFKRETMAQKDNSAIQSVVTPVLETPQSLTGTTGTISGVTA
jgi:hypothetical protein